MPRAKKEEKTIEVEGFTPKEETLSSLPVDGIFEAGNGHVAVVKGVGTGFEGQDSFREAVRFYKVEKGI